jgi:hypothetical protein
MWRIIPVERRWRDDMQRYRVYLAKPSAALPEAIELLSASHEEVLKSAANLIGSHLMIEVWYRTSCEVG